MEIGHPESTLTAILRIKAGSGGLRCINIYNFTVSKAIVCPILFSVVIIWS